MRRFSDTRDIDRSEIILQPERFQGRQGDYAQATVDAIVNQGSYDRSMDPIVVWWDPEAAKYVVISGHSRWEAAKRLYESGKQADLKTIPAKVFQGDLDDAIDYATLESNRGGTDEGIVSDIQAYRQAVKSGKNKKELARYFKPESKLRALQDLSNLAPKGRFIEALASDAARSYPYLERNARWVGQLRRRLPALTDPHENELFRYFYSTGGTNKLKLAKDKFYDLVDKKVNRIDFDPDQALNLENRVSPNALTDPINDQIKEHEQEIDKLNKKINGKRESIVRAQNEGVEQVIPQLKEQISDAEKVILRRMQDIKKLQQDKGKVERTTTFDLFSEPASPAPEPDPKPEEPRKAESQITDASQAVGDMVGDMRKEKGSKYKKGDRVNVVVKGTTHYNLPITDVSFREGSFLRPGRFTYQLKGLKGYHQDHELTPYNSADQGGKEEGETGPGYPLLDPSGRLYEQALHAWDAVSMRPDKRGEDFMRQHENELQDYYRKFKGTAEHNGKDYSLSDFDGDFANKYRSYVSEFLGRQSRTMSSMITGPAKFPTRKAEKANAALDKTLDKWQNWMSKRSNGIMKELSDWVPKTGNPEANIDPVEDDLKEARELQDEMKAVNALYRKYKKDPSVLSKADPKRQNLIKRFEKEKYNFQTRPFDYELTNNNARIKRLESRLAELKEKSELSQQDSPTIERGDITIEINAEENRLQIFFPGKPTDEQRKELKANGFRWAPSKGAWQRVYTDNALRSLQHIGFLDIKNAKDEFGLAPKNPAPDSETKSTTEYAHQLTKAEWDAISTDQKYALSRGYGLGAMERLKLADGEYPHIKSTEDKHHKLRREAKDLYKKANDIMDSIPAGQPIVSVADRNRRERSGELIRKAGKKEDEAEKIEADLPKKSEYPAHKHLLSLALEKGMEVPELVLKDYPDLQSPKKKPAMKIYSIARNEDKRNPATYNQLQYFKKLGGEVDTAESQVTRKFDKDVMSDAIDELKDGEKVRIQQMPEPEPKPEPKPAPKPDLATEEPTECPPKTKDGKRRIDAQGLSLLNKCLDKQVDTKKRHTNASGTYTKKRQELHDKIVEGIRGKNECVKQRKPVAVLTGGAPGSGKSTWLKKYAPWTQGKDVLKIDADDVRSQLPEYEGWNANITHEETRDIVQRLFKNIGDPCTVDLVYDGTMNKARKYEELIKQFKDMGYQVFVLYVEVPEKVARERVLKRYRDSGRYVPKSVIDKIYKTGLNAYQKAINLADGYVKIDGLSGKLAESGGKQLPKRRELSKAPSKQDQMKAQRLKKDIDNHLTMDEDQVLRYARQVNALRKIPSQNADNTAINKKVLPPTFEGLIRWAKNPGAYDIAGVDAPASAKTTVKPRVKKNKLQSPGRSSAGFWQKLWKGDDSSK